MTGQLAGSIPDGATSNNSHRLRAGVGDRHRPHTDPCRITAIHEAIRAQLVASSPIRSGAHPLWRLSQPEQRREMLAAAEVDGALVGGASLKADDFWAIAEACGRSRQASHITGETPKRRAMIVLSIRHSRLPSGGGARRRHPAAEERGRRARHGGGGGMSGFMTGRSTANLLTRTTAILAALFFLTSVILAVLSQHSGAPRSLVDQGSPPSTRKHRPRRGAGRTGSARDPARTQRAARQTAGELAKISGPAPVFRRPGSPPPAGLPTDRARRDHEG